MNSNESPNQYSIKIPEASEIDDRLNWAINWLASKLTNANQLTWGIICFLFLLLGIVVGAGFLLKVILWIAIGSFCFLTVSYGISFANEFKLKGFAEAAGKGQTFCYALFAGMTFWLLPDSVPPALTVTRETQPIVQFSEPNQNEQATTAYWNELRSISKRCEQAGENLSKAFKGEFDRSSKLDPIQQFRHEIRNASGHINRLSLDGVDSEVVGLAIEMDAILADSLVLLDEAVEFVKDQWTVQGMFKALIEGTKTEEASLTSQEKRLNDRLIAWSATQTKIRSRLSVEYRKTLPAITPPY